jgi:hypothetical protein
LIQQRPQKKEPHAAGSGTILFGSTSELDSTTTPKGRTARRRQRDNPFRQHHLKVGGCQLIVVSIFLPL